MMAISTKELFDAAKNISDTRPAGAYREEDRCVIDLDVWDDAKNLANNLISVQSLVQELENVRMQNAILRQGLRVVETLIAESGGVFGLHLNGDPSPWSELRTGGRFEEWLIDFDIALELPEELEGITQCSNKS